MLGAALGALVTVAVALGVGRALGDAGCLDRQVGPIVARGPLMHETVIGVPQTTTVTRTVKVQCRKADGEEARQLSGRDSPASYVLWCRVPV